MPRPPRGKLYIDGVWDASSDPQSGDNNVSPNPQSNTQNPTSDPTTGSPYTAQGATEDAHTTTNTQEPTQTTTPIVEGTFDTWHPSTTEKLKIKLEQNIDKIPVFNFFHIVHQQATMAKKETMIELTSKGETGWKAGLMGFLYGGLLSSTVDLPGALYDTAKTIWDSIPSETQGPLGLNHPQKEKVITGNPDKEVENDLILAGSAPGVYSTYKNIQKQNTILEKQAKELSSKREQLEKEAQWFEEYKEKAQNDPFFAKVYNAEAAEFNREVSEYNQQALNLKRHVEELKQQFAPIEKFNKNLKQTSKSFAVGELAGGLVYGTAAFGAASDTLGLIAPERTVESIRLNSDIFSSKPSTRVTVKETTYKGWLRKKPIETNYSTGLIPGDVPIDEALSKLKAGNVEFMKSFTVDDTGAFLKIAGRDSREFVMSKAWSKKPFESSPTPSPKDFISPDDFETITGKPWTVGVEKIDDLGMRIKSGDDVVDVFLPGATPDTDTEALVAVKKSEFSKKFTPEFKLQFENPLGLSTEDWEILNRITKAGARRSGNKWIKVSKSGNVFQSFYDPPVEAEQTVQKNGLVFKPEMGSYKFNPSVSIQDSIILPQLLLENVDVPYLRQDMGQQLGLLAETTPQMLNKPKKKQSTPSKRSQGVVFWWNLDEDILRLKNELRRIPRDRRGRQPISPQPKGIDTQSIIDVEIPNNPTLPQEETLQLNMQSFDIGVKPVTSTFLKKTTAPTFHPPKFGLSFPTPSFPPRRRAGGGRGQSAGELTERWVKQNQWGDIKLGLDSLKQQFDEMEKMLGGKGPKKSGPKQRKGVGEWGMVGLF